MNWLNTFWHYRELVYRLNSVEARYFRILYGFQNNKNKIHKYLNI